MNNRLLGAGLAALLIVGVLVFFLQAPSTGGDVPEMEPTPIPEPPPTDYKPTLTKVPPPVKPTPEPVVDEGSDELLEPTPAATFAASGGGLKMAMNQLMPAMRTCYANAVEDDPELPSNQTLVMVFGELEDGASTANTISLPMGNEDLTMCIGEIVTDLRFEPDGEEMPDSFTYTMNLD